MDPSSVLTAALVRALIISVIAGVSAAAAALATTDDVRTIAAAGLSAFAATLLVRLGGEGGFELGGALLVCSRTIFVGLLRAAPPLSVLTPFLRQLLHQPPYIGALSGHGLFSLK